MQHKANNSLFQEAVLDALKVKEVAIKEAQHSVLEAITPRIREFVEQEILNPTVPGDDIDDIGGDDVAEVSQCPECPVVPEPIVNVEFEQSLDSTLMPLMTAIKSNDAIGAASAIIDILRNTSRLNTAIPQIKETKTFKRRVSSLLNGIEYIYAYVQEVVTDTNLKQKLSEQLENSACDLKKIHEDMMKNTMKNKRQLREDDQIDLSADQGEQQGDAKKKVSLNIDVPADLADDLVAALGDIEISLDDEADADDVELEITDDEAVEEVPEEPAAKAPVDDVDASGGEEEELQLNSRKLSDDTVVEIDEAMLRSELRRLSLKEDKFPVPSTKGAGPGDSLDDFGGATDKEEPLDVDVTTEAIEGAGKATDSDEEILCDDEAAKCEALKRRLTKEARIQKIAKLNSKRAQREGRAARSSRNVKRYNAAKSAFLKEVKTYNESVTRAQKIRGVLSEALKGSRSNSAPKANVLRRKLAESNLDNVKLQYANKLLRSDALTNNDKLKIVEQLETARSIQEAKVIYESSMKLLATKQVPRKITESTGSASRVSRSGAPTKTLSEGVELDRWAQLAGLTK